MDADIFQNFLRDVADIESFPGFVKENYVYIENDVEKKRFNPLLHLNENEFRSKYRFTKENMQRVIDFIRDDLDISDVYQLRRPQVPVDIQVMAALRFWGRTEHPLMTSYVHGVSSCTLSRICRRVSAALASKASFHIRMPATLSDKEATTHAFHMLAKVPSVIGAVEHHTVRFRKQVSQNSQKSNSTIYTKDAQIHIQIISDALCKIRDIDCKLRQLKHEDGSAFVDINEVNETFTQSRIKERFEQNEFRGRILLGGSRLSGTSYLLTPVEYPISHKEKLYNRALAATLAPAEECLHLWKNRFCILQSEICSTFNTARNTIVALAVLHNLAVDWDDQALNQSIQADTKVNGSTQHSSAKVLDTNTRAEFIKNHF